MERIPTHSEHKHFLAQSVLDDFAGDSDIWSSLRTATSRARAVVKVALNRIRARTAALCDFAESGMRAVAERLSGILRLPSVCQMFVMAVPSGNVALFEVKTNAPSLARELVGRTFDSGRQAGPRQVGAALEADWRVQTDTVEHDACNPIDSSTLPKPSLCSLSGRCACRGDGRQLATFRAKFLRSLTSLLRPAVKEYQTRLRHDLFFVRLTGAQVDGGTPGQGGIVATVGVAEVFLHIALMYLRPWPPTFQRMLVPSGCTYDPGDLQANASGEWLSVWDALHGLDRRLTWHCESFQLLERQRPILSLSPSIAAIRPLHGAICAPTPFWTPAVRRRAAPPTARAAFDGDAAGDVHFDDASDEDAEAEIAADEVQHTNC